MSDSGQRPLEASDTTSPARARALERCKKSEESVIACTAIAASKPATCRIAGGRLPAPAAAARACLIEARSGPLRIRGRAGLCVLSFLEHRVAAVRDAGRGFGGNRRRGA